MVAMTKRAVPKKPTAKPLPKDLAINRRRERRLFLPVDTLIEGSLADGRKFKEETRLENISSGGAYFKLDSGVVVGSKLNLYIDLPEKLVDGKKRSLRIGGITVRLEKPDRKSKKQCVAVRFESEDFDVIPPKKSPKKS